MNTIKIVASITVDPDNGSGSTVYGSTFFAFLSPIWFEGSVTGKLFRISSSGSSSTLSARPDGLSASVYESVDGGYDTDGGRRITVTHEAGPLIFTSSMEIDIPTTVPFNIADFDHITFPEQYAGNYLYGPAVEGYFVKQTVQIYHHGSLLGDVRAETLDATYSSYRSKRQDITYPQPGQQGDFIEMDITLPAVQVDGSITRDGGGGGVGGVGGVGGGGGGGAIVTTRSVLKRKSRVSITQAVASTPPTPGYWKDVPEPEIQPTVQKLFPFGQGGGGLPNTYTVTLVPGTGLPVEGGSASDLSRATTMAIRLPDGSVQVIRV